MASSFMLWLSPVIETLTAWGLATGVARSAYVYAAVSASHVLGIALLVGPVLLADLRIAGALRALDSLALSILRRTAMLGVVLTVATGVLLLSAKPADYAANSVVWIKLAVIAAALANALRFEWRWRRHGAALMSGGARWPAAFSIVLWLTAIALGRWIAFV